MRILQVVDSPWAIGALAKKIADGNSHHRMEILTIHPKDYRANKEEFNKMFTEKVKGFSPDLIHFHYWDTANDLSRLPVCEGIKKILTHHNQRNLLSHKWDKIDLLVVHTKKAKDILFEAGYWNVEIVQHGIDIEKFQFNTDYDTENRTIGYTGRIVPWKGLVDILKVAKEIDSEVIMMGKIDKADYWRECLEFQDQMDIRFGTPDDAQVAVYHEMGIYVGNSCDGIEEGTLGFLEAMACGIPVVTTPSGEAMDIIKHGENGIIVDFENFESLLAGVKFVLSMTPAEKEEMRQKAWETVRHLSKEVMALNYEKLYYHLFYKKDLVSVIIPSCNRADTLVNVLNSYEKQTYKPIEIIVVIDDKFDIKYEEMLIAWKNTNSTPIKWLYTDNEGYGIAQARNMGIFEAKGHYLIFNDDRFVPELNAVDVFATRLSGKKEKTAIWGDKGAGRRDFIENFFIIRKKHITQAGMFNERINEYGGQSQELRERLKAQGFDLIYEPEAKATTQFGTHNKTKKRYELFRTKLKLWKLSQ